MYVRRIRLLVLLLTLGVFACDRPGPREAPAFSPSGEEVVPDTTMWRSTNGGTVRGQVLFDGNPPPPAWREVSIARDLCGDSPKSDRGLQVDPESRGIQYAVVTLESVTFDTPPVLPSAPQSATLDLARCEFFPYVRFLAPGGILRIRNADDGLHAVRRESTLENRVSLPPDTAGSMRFSEADHVRLVCELHYWSSAWVVVTDAPFFAATGAKGRFEFEGVPPGIWTLRVWHERMGKASRQVTVSSGEERFESLLLGGESPP